MFNFFTASKTPDSNSILLVP